MTRLSQAQSADTLRVYLLGSFRLECNAQTIHLPTRKVESLLAYLLLYPEAHPREKLAALLWGDSSDELARRSLRTALSALRKVLGDDVLIADRETIQVNPDFPLWVDASQVSGLKSQPAGASESNIENLKSNIENYRGDLLPDFYDEWILPERERLRALYLDALLRFAQHARSRSEYAQAMNWAQKVLASDPANEKAYQHIIFCSAATGDRIGALKQFDECANKLRDELGVEPSRETIALRDRIEQELTGGKSREALLTNLPHPLTSFVGREREIEEIKRLLAQHRLVTLTGSGGCGKTRLAIEVASQLVESFRNGVWWVDLAPLSDAALVPQAIAQSLGVREEPNQPLDDTLVNYLRAKRLLLVLDNCEHLISACAILADKLLSACAELQMLATSREALGITGEVAWRVPSFTLPDVEHLPPLEQLMQYDAIQLFVQRATAVVPQWRLNGNAPSVARVCARLDGIPLAIELAAARVKVLSVEQIAARLDDRFNLLTMGSRAALARQQTLRATIDWSYDLLSDAERMLLRRSSVFAGGWMLEAMEFVCARGGIQASEVLDLLTHLVDKSLVNVEEHEGAMHYRMFETIREYAREKLVESGEAATMRGQHLSYYLHLAQQADSKLYGPEQFVWVNLLEIEHNNLRAALECSLTEGQADQGLELAMALLKFWRLRGHESEGRQWVARLLKHPQTAAKNLRRANGLMVAGVLNWIVADYKASRQNFEELVPLARELGEPSKQALALGLGYLSEIIFGDDPSMAEAMLEEALAIAKGLDVQWVLAQLLWLKGWCWRGKQDDSTALQAFEQALSLWRSIGDKRHIAHLRRWIGSMYFRRHDYLTATEYTQQSLLFARETRDKSAIVDNLLALGEIERAEGKYDLAWTHQSEGLELARELGQMKMVAGILNNLGDIALHEGDPNLAKSLLTEGLGKARELNAKPVVAFGLLGFAGVMAAEKRARQAAQLLGVYAKFLESGDTRNNNPADKAQYQHNLGLTLAQMDEATFDDAWEEGRAMTLEQAVEVASENMK